MSGIFFIDYFLLAIDYWLLIIAYSLFANAKLPTAKL